MIAKAEAARRYRPGLIEQIHAWLMRIVAALSLVSGLMWWVRLSGYYPGPLWRFDLMPVEWQMPSVTLAVLYPFAALGLWLLASWGPVIWFVCAAVEATMYGWFPDIYGQNDLRILGHLAVILLYGLLRIAMRIQRRRRR